MIFAVVAPRDGVAFSALERLAESSCGAASASSVRGGVGIAAWHDFDGASFSDDRAQVGTRPEPSDDALGPLAGDFAMVARIAGGLRLSRGRFAGRPLFWMRWRTGVVACSRFLPLLELSRKEVRVNDGHILAMFDMALQRTPLPVLAAHRVRANTFVDIDRSGTTATTLGAIHVGPELKLTAAQLAKEAATQFDRAVRRQCGGAKHVAVFSGGGVDSSNLLATAIRASRRSGDIDITPIAFDFGGPGDDRPHLAALSRHLAVEPVRIRPAEGVHCVNQDFVIDGFAHASGPGAPFIAAAIRARDAGATGVLVGDGSELLLDSDEAVFGDFLLAHPLSAIACAWRFRGVGETRWRAIRRLAIAPLGRRFLPSVTARRRKKRRAMPDWWGPRLRAHFAGPRRPSTRAPILSQRQRVLELASSDLLMSIREHICRWEQVAGLSFHLPYFDDEYVRFLARVPSQSMFAGNRERGLLRESMAGLVPDSVRYRADKAHIHPGFEEFFLAAGGIHAVGHLVTAPALTAFGFVDGKAFRTTFERFAEAPDRHPDAWFSLWSTLSAEAFLQWFLVFTGRPVPS